MNSISVADLEKDRDQVWEQRCRQTAEYDRDRALTVTVMVDPIAGTMTPSIITDARNGTKIHFVNADRTTDLKIAQSSSLETPCIQVASGHQTFYKDSEFWGPIPPSHSVSCGSAGQSRHSIGIIYLGNDPLMLYNVGGCQRGMVLSVNLPPDDVPTLSANAKLALKEETPDSSYYGTPREPPWCRSGHGSPASGSGIVDNRFLSSGRIIVDDRYPSNGRAIVDTRYRSGILHRSSIPSYPPYPPISGHPSSDSVVPSSRTQLYTGLFAGVIIGALVSLLAVTLTQARRRQRKPLEMAEAEPLLKEVCHDKT